MNVRRGQVASVDAWVLTTHKTVIGFVSQKKNDISAFRSTVQAIRPFPRVSVCSGVSRYRFPETTGPVTQVQVEFIAACGHTSSAGLT